MPQRLPLTLRRARSPQELQDAKDALKRAGYEKCDSCHRYSNEDQRMTAGGGASASDICAFCGCDWGLIARMDALS